MAAPGVSEAKPIPVQREHLVAGAGIEQKTTAAQKLAKTEAASFIVAVNEKGGSAEKARRALKAVDSKDRQAHYDGGDPKDVLDTIKDKRVRDEAALQIGRVRTQMAAIDVLKVSTPAERDARFAALKKEGRLPKDVKNVSDLIAKASQYIVSDKYFAEFFKDYQFDDTTPLAVAQALFLEGSNADLVQASLSERVGLIQQRISELPVVPLSQKDQLDAAQRTAAAIKKGAEDEIKKQTKDIITNAGGDATKVDAAVESRIIAAAETEDKVVRVRKLADVLAESSDISPDMLRGIHTYEDNLSELARLRQQGSTNTTRIIAELERDTLDAQTNPGSVAFLAAVSKYHTIESQVQTGEMQSLSELYRENKSLEMKKRLEILGSGAVATGTTQEETKRALAEQDLLADLETMSSGALSEAIDTRTRELSAGAMIEADRALAESHEKGDQAQVDILTVYKTRMTHGAETFVEDVLKDPKDPKDPKKGRIEVVHIDKIEEAMAVISRNDTKFGADGTRFMMAYKAGFFDSNKTAAADVLSGKTSAAEALGKLSADARKQLDAFCTPEQVKGFTGHLFAEFARVQQFIDASGAIGKGEGGLSKWLGEKSRLMKGYNVKIDGDPGKLKIMKNYWGKILETHATEVQTAIDENENAQDMMRTLERKGWVGADGKTKNLLYLLMMMLGMVALPVTAAVALPGVAIGGVGMAGLSAVGGLAGAKGAGRVAQRIS